MARRSRIPRRWRDPDHSDGEQFPGVADKELENRADHEQEHVDGEHEPPAEAVGEPTEDGPADKDADQRGRPDQALPDRGDLQVRDDERER
jgi:hypothetical protein